MAELANQMHPLEAWFCVKGVEELERVTSMFFRADMTELALHWSLAVASSRESFLKPGSHCALLSPVDPSPLITNSFLTKKLQQILLF